jgi:reactive intermediate/imine deaminase
MSMFRISVTVCFFVFSAFVYSAEVTHLNNSGDRTEGLPFSEAVRVGDTLYLSGQIGARPGKMGVVPGGIVPESRQALANIRGVLKSNGLDMRDVVKCTVMLADIAEWGQFNEVYKEFFSEPFPARSAFGASGLALGARVELECMAVFP